MTDKYAVLGNPIAHSKSPMIHAEFAKQTNQDISYEAKVASLDDFTNTINRLIAEGYKGVNVTVPFKFEAFDVANHIDNSALVGEASNTLVFHEGVTTAYNTDGIGLVTDIQKNLGVSLQGKRVLMVGAGGAAQGVALEMAKINLAAFVVVNRSLEKVHEMQRKLESAKESDITAITASSFDGLGGQVFDVVINATSAGLTGSALPIPDSIFTSSTLAYDMMYGRETSFMAQARLAGAQVTGGLGMLVEQAAEAFSIWRGVRPTTKPVIATIIAL
ncbi:MAG TPA: shikimate dehydrogenase [Methylophilaceae bacterium]|jgi:shikimate dehydrogenase|nr:shikimate dehydrogenase [Methylophilaceae bacterium]